MRSSSPAMLLAAFVLGACTTVAVQSAASRTDATDELGDPGPTPAGEGPTVVALAEAPQATAPNQSGSITHLARGHNAYIGLLRMQGGGAVPVHRDSTEEFIHVLEGAGTMTIDGQTHDVVAGTTVYMPADAEVSFQNGAAQLVALQVFAGPAPAAKYDSWTVMP